MPDELPATSCVSGAMKVSEHKATPVTFQFVDVSLIDVNARLPYRRHRAAGLLRKSGRYGAKGKGGRPRFDG
jgi:hypothetical protein